MADAQADQQQTMSKQEAEEFIAKVFLQQKLLNDQEQKENVRLARQMKIQQETYKYSRPADKRAMKFILVGNLTFHYDSESIFNCCQDLQFDMADMFHQFSTLLQEDGVTRKDVQGSEEAFANYADFMVTWGNMMHRKLTNEAESYYVANVSKGGWATEKSKLFLKRIWIECNENVS